MPDMTAPQALPVDGPCPICGETVSAEDVFPTDEVWIHTRFHGDEALQYILGKLYGQKRLPGFASAPIKLVDSGIHMETGKDGCYRLRKLRRPCLGCYGGLLDEHPKPGHHADNFKQQNGARKMARLLGIDDDPALQEILKYSLRSDRTSNRGPFDIDPILKEWWRMGLPMTIILAMYEDIFNSWYHHFSGRPRIAKPQGTFRNCIARWMIHKFGAENPNLEGLLERLRTGKQVADKLKLWDKRGVEQTFNLDLRESGKTPFDLEGVWDAMWAAGIPADSIERIGITCLEAKHREQVKFAEAEDEFRAKAQYLESKTHPYRVAFIHSDSDYINRAARHLDPDLDMLIMSLSSGHFRTFVMQKHLLMDPIAARWREAELFKRKGRHSLAWSYLESRGTIKECPQVYNSHDGLGAFNSTETSPNTEATALGRKEIERVHDEGLTAVWQTHRSDPAKKHNEMVARAKRHKREKKAERASAQPQ